MSTNQHLARLGSIAAVGGAILLFVSTLLHPLNSDPNDPPAAFAEYAADSLWVWSHLGQFLGVALLGMALVALATTFNPGQAAAWSRFGQAGAAAIIAVAAVLQAVDGVALKVMVDRWAADTEETRVFVFEAAFAVRQIEIGLASLLSLLSGFTLIIFGVSIVLSPRYPLWMGWIGLLGGLGLVATGAAQASTGFSDLAMTLSMLASAVFLIWVILVGILIWRLAPRLVSDNDAA
ncbi:MAG: hypothetical protein KME20_01685 [Kaiparowitsia implicata GSE-PSE-MK54-09C]|jgi:hypothetical protein|nr:hypothetical protein [Kaiparowitsia implicata GSE-PSE-MK54-09C]